MPPSGKMEESNWKLLKSENKLYFLKEKFVSRKAAFEGKIITVQWYKPGVLKKPDHCEL